MSEFRLEVVGVKKFKTHAMPGSNEVQEKLNWLWAMCWDSKPNWNPLGKFEFRQRGDSDPKFRVRDFERGREDGVGGLDLLGTYRRHDSLVTIYIDSCVTAARRYNASLDDLVDVVLIHELTHLVTHRGLGRDDLSSHFMEFTAQCATYAYLKSHAEDALKFCDEHEKSGIEQELKVFEHLSKRQPFIYQTWESLKELPKCSSEILTRPTEVQEVVKGLFQKVLYTLRPPGRDETIDVLNY